MDEKKTNSSGITMDRPDDKPESELDAQVFEEIETAYIAGTQGEDEKKVLAVLEKYSKMKEKPQYAAAANRDLAWLYLFSNDPENDASCGRYYFGLLPKAEQDAISAMLECIEADAWAAEVSEKKCDMPKGEISPVVVYELENSHKRDHAANLLLASIRATEYPCVSARRVLERYEAFRVYDLYRNWGIFYLGLRKAAGDPHLSTRKRGEYEVMATQILEGAKRVYHGAAGNALYIRSYNRKYFGGRSCDYHLVQSALSRMSVMEKPEIFKKYFREDPEMVSHYAKQAAIAKEDASGAEKAEIEKIANTGKAVKKEAKGKIAALYILAVVGAIAYAFVDRAFIVSEIFWPVFMGTHIVVSLLVWIKAGLFDDSVWPVAVFNVVSWFIGFGLVSSPSDMTLLCAADVVGHLIVTIYLARCASKDAKESGLK